MRLHVVVAILSCSLLVEATIVAKTSLNECTNYGAPELKNRKDEPCNTKLVIALTVQANEVGAMYMYMFMYSL